MPTDADDDQHVREVRSADPSLSQHANDLLTDELREVVGHDRKTVRDDVPDRTHARHGTHSSLLAGLASNRIGLVIFGLVLIITAGTYALVTGSWWVMAVLVLAILVSAAIVVMTTLGLVRETEHLQPSTVERLEEEGVADPDRAFTELVDEFADHDGEAVRQRETMTPSSEPTEPVGPGDSR